MFRPSMRNFVRMIVLISVVLVAGRIGSAAASEPLVIAVSPSLAALIERYWEGRFVLYAPQQGQVELRRNPE